MMTNEEEAKTERTTKEPVTIKPDTDLKRPIYSFRKSIEEK